MSASGSVGDENMVELITSSDENDESPDGFELDIILKAGKSVAAALRTLDNFSCRLQGKASKSMAPTASEGPPVIYPKNKVSGRNH